jgi:uncharacterized protein
MGIGEAAVTILTERGTPTPVAWTMLRPPVSRMGPLSDEEQQALVSGSALSATYGTATDRLSARERLQAPPLSATESPDESPRTPAPQREPASRGRGKADDRGVVGDVLASSAFRSGARAAATVAGREIARSLFGTSSRRRRR